eukprot:SAG22_NODE_127_length_18798_cov_11.748757_9_plen_361_part_00
MASGREGPFSLGRVTRFTPDTRRTMFTILTVLHDTLRKSSRIFVSGEVFTEPPVYPGLPKDLPPWRPPLSPPTGEISLLRVRKHGFVAVEGPSRPLLPLANTTGCRARDYPSAAGPSELYPGFTTVALDMPDNCRGHLILAVNAKTSVAGFVQIGFVSRANMTDHSRYRLCNSDPLRGNFLAATASWGGGSVRTLPTGGRHSVQLEVILVAAKLFSLQFKCMAAPALKTEDGIWRRIDRSILGDKMVAEDTSTSASTLKAAPTGIGPTFADGGRPLKSTANWWHYTYSLCHAVSISTPAGLPSLTECPSTEGQAGLYPLSPQCVAKWKAACEAVPNPTAAASTVGAAFSIPRPAWPTVGC